MSDDASIRRSKRTPIPKRNFKLLDDDYQQDKSKEPTKKKERKVGKGNVMSYKNFSPF